MSFSIHASKKSPEICFVLGSFVFIDLSLVVMFVNVAKEMTMALPGCTVLKLGRIQGFFIIHVNCRETL